MKPAASQVYSPLMLNRGSAKTNTRATMIMIIALLLYNVTPYLDLSSFAQAFIQHVSINIVMAVSLYVIIVMDMISLAQSGFMAIGAYTAVLLAMNGQTNVVILLLAAAFTSAVSGFILGVVVSKVRGVYFVLVSFAFTGLITSIISNTTALGRANGFAGIPPMSIWLPWTGKQLLGDPQSMMKVILAVTTLTIIIAALWTGKFRSVTRSIHEDENLSRSLGLNVVKYRILGICLSSSIAGIGGVLMAFYLTSISPDTFYWTNSVNYLAYNIVGGTGGLIGPIIGTLLLDYVSQAFSGLVEYNLGLFGLVLILFTILFRGGIYGILVSAARRISGTNKKAAGAKGDDPQ